MSDTAQVTYKQSTFSDTSKRMEEFENSQTHPAAAPSEPIQTPVSGIPPVDPASAPIQTPSAEGQPPVTPDTPPAEPDITTSVFEMNLEGESATASTPPNNTETTPTSPAYNWKDEIKKIDPQELLKEIGVNDFAIEINEHLSKGGNAADYLNAKAIDYNKVPDEELVKSGMRAKYPSFTAEEVNRMYVRKYGTEDDTLTEDEKQDRLLELKAEAYNIRQTKIAEQQRFKIPEAPVPQKNEAYEQWEQNMQQQSRLIEQAKQYYLGHDATKNLNESKKVTISLGEGVAPFNFVVEKPELITQSLTDDGETWRKLTSTKSGEPDVQKEQLITLFAFNPEKFVKDIFNYGVQTGKQKLVAEGQNAQKPQAIVTQLPISDKATVTGTGTYGDRSR